MSNQAATRRIYEDQFVAELKAAGVEGVQSYLFIPQDGKSEEGMYGVGASFRIVGPLGVIVEAERYQNVGDQSTTGEANINAVSLGLVVRF